MHKKFTASLAGTVAAGLVAFSAPVAVAGPYTGTVPTKCAAAAPSTSKAKKPVRVKVKLTDASNATPKGKIVVKVYDANGNLVDKNVYRYDADRVKYPTDRIQSKGKYKIVVKFIPNDNSRFKKSRAVSATKVA